MLKKELLFDKARATALHFVLSLAVTLMAAALIFGVWYPYPFREVSGGLALFGLLVSVDVTIGPLLTWVVFDRRKPHRELRRDLGVIVLLQVAALSYGLWSMYQARPVYLVHEVDRFVVVSAADIDPADLPKAAPPFQSVPPIGIHVIGLRAAKDPAEKLWAMEFALAGKDLSLQPSFWQALSEENLEVIRKRARPLSLLRDRGSVEKRLIDGWLAKQSAQVGDFLYFPLVSREHFWTMVIDARSLNRVGYLPIDPF